MSEYLAMKKQLEELQGRIESVRLAEIESEITDIKQRIAAFGIRPEQLFSPDDLKALDGRSRNARIRRKGGEAAPAFAWPGTQKPPVTAQPRRLARDNT